MPPPLQMAGAYSVFANGGYRINPQPPPDPEGRVDARGKVLSENPAAAKAAPMYACSMHARPLSPTPCCATWCAWVRHGQPRAKQALLGRNDLAGKTGTTNDAVDAWRPRRLHAQPGGGPPGCRLRPAQEPGRARDRRRPGAADLGWSATWARCLQGRTGKPGAARAGKERRGHVAGGDWTFEEMRQRRRRGLGWPGRPAGRGQAGRSSARSPADVEAEKKKILEMFGGA
ncbi:hypothetical protein ACTMU2_34540 [Cupriavidus basilensis]